MEHGRSRCAANELRRRSVPEITSVDAIREKLRECDERLAELTETARALARIRSTVERMQQETGQAQAQVQSALAEFQRRAADADTLQQAWKALQSEVRDARAGLAEKQTELLDAASKLDERLEGMEGTVSTVLAD